MTNQSISNYEDFIKTKSFCDVVSGFEFPENEINTILFHFQRACVKWAIQRGRAALFEDTGLGKTYQQVEWARIVNEKTGGNILIFAPLCVAQQTVEEAEKLGISINYCRGQDAVQDGITITNYEMMDHFDESKFIGVVLDESSILKSQDGKTRSKLIEKFQHTPYRLACTATPAPNDHMELGNHAEFLGVMSATEMLAMFFTHDGGQTSKWRLKGHAKKRFWEWMSTWSICIRRPSDLGYDDDGYILPALNIYEHIIETKEAPEGDLFKMPAQTLMERRSAKRSSLVERIDAVADLVNSNQERWVVWCHLNEESSELAKRIPDAVEVYGSLDMAEKERRIMAFTHQDARVIITKPRISGFGMNWQSAHHMAFAGIDDSFEAFYQAVRREYRFGQKHPVNVHLFSSDIEGNVKQNLERKQGNTIKMAESMVNHMKELTQKQIVGSTGEKSEYKENVDKGENYTLCLGDCVKTYAAMPSESIDYTVFSPPFSSLYVYSNSDYDMGNCKGDNEFFGQFKFLINELFRVTKPGRLLSFHCMNMQTLKSRDGYIGVRDFRGELIRAFIESGWIYHSEVCIWKDPVTAMHRTKAIGLLWKQLKKDSSMSRQGIPDYLVTMRKPGENQEFISHSAKEYPVDKWQKIASPVWMDINPSNTLQFRSARENDDERHIAPLQLDVIERALELWSNPGDLVSSPFAGIGSEGYVAIKMGRRFIGVELKPAYWEIARKNLDQANKEQIDLFSGVL